MTTRELRDAVWRLEEVQVRQTDLAGVLSVTVIADF